MTGKLIAFVPTLDLTKARSFYEGILNLRLVSEDGFAFVFEADGTMLRVTKVDRLTPQPFTVLGWEVADISDSVSRFVQRGIRFEHYGMSGQDDRGIWTSPSGARIAWFKDPDGNVLSLTQFS
jgi:predicted enzyme related to lactoylglutathione lyase